MYTDRQTDLKKLIGVFYNLHEMLKNKYNLSHKICVMFPYYIRLLLLLLLLCAFLNTLEIVIFVINY